MEPGRNIEEDGRADMADMEEASHSVLGELESREAATQLVEDLEEHGVPTNAIHLVGGETKESPDPDTKDSVVEARAFGAIARSAFVGAVLGLAAGAALGLLGALLTQGFPWPWGLVGGGVFGTAAGGVAGGMSVAKYSSPAWNATQEIEQTSQIGVGVLHADPEVIETAADVMERHVRGDVTRLGEAES